MPKKFVYDIKEINTIWMEQLLNNFPDEDIENKFSMTTPQTRIVLFHEFINRMGELGWELVNGVSSHLGNGAYHIFKKEVYVKTLPKPAPKKKPAAK